jgi:RNA polymerase sigma factor (sigma-70 family)
MQANTQSLLQHLCRLAHPLASELASDACLLERFVRCRDEDSFAVIVSRHGPMVYNVCRRLVADTGTAEDCFQATFLVLARRAATVRPPEALAGWLYGVARRVALKARTRRTLHPLPAEHRIRPAPGSDPLDALTAREVLEVLDEELQRLPVAYRLPLVYCCLEGLSQEEAAHRLGWTPGSVKGRLERGRARLHQRLMKRGLSLPAALAAVEVSRGGVFPPTLAANTVRTALVNQASVGVAALANGDACALGLGRFRSVLAALLLLTASVLGVGLLTQPPAVTTRSGEPQRAAKEPSQKVETRPGTDLQGDPLPAGALVRLGTVRWRHQHRSSADLPTVFSPDGKTVFTGGDGTLKSWETATGKLLFQLPREYPGRMLVSPNGKWLATSDSELLDATSGRLVRRHSDGGRPLAFSPDSGLLAIGVADGTIALWNTSTGEVAHRLRGQEKQMFCGAFTPNGRTFVALFGDKKIYHWEVATGALRRTVALPIPSWRILDLSPDGRTLAVTSGKQVGLWDTTTAEHRGNLGEDAANARYGLAFSKDSKTLATDWYDSVTHEARICIWDVASRKLLRHFPVPTTALGFLFFGSDNRTLASSGTNEPLIRLWDTGTVKQLNEYPAHHGDISGLAFTPDGRTLVSGSSDGTLRVWETATGRNVRSLPGHANGVSSLAVTPDGRAVLSGGYDAQLLLQDWQTGKELRRLVLVPKEKLSPNVSYGPQLRLAADGRTALVHIGMVGGGALDYIWDPTDGRVLVRREDRSAPDTVIISPDMRTLASFVTTSAPAATSSDPRAKAGDTEVVSRQIVLHDVATGQPRLAIPLLDRHGYLAGFSPDGRMLVTHGFQTRTLEKGDQPENYTFRLWELATGQERLAFRAPKDGYQAGFEQMAVSPDNRFLSTARQDRTIQVWDLATGAELLNHSGYDAAVRRLAFRPDGKVLASGHADSTILLWNLSGLKPRPGGPPTAQQSEQAWADLSSSDARKAYAAIWKMVAPPERVVPLLASKLNPAVPASKEELRKLLTDLDSASYERREAASRRLVEIGDLAEPALEKALKDNISTEKRRRIEQILGMPRVVRAPEKLRALRAVEVLERIGTVEARRILETLAGGAAEAHLTREARASLDRLDRRPAAAP